MSNLYTPLGEAREILGNRLRDEDLKERVTAYVGGVLPEIFVAAEKPIGVLARYVPRGTSEDKIFTELSLEASLEPYCFSYLGDGYSQRNPEKTDVLRPPISWGKNKTRSWIVDRGLRGGPLGYIPTQFGMTTADYQGGLRRIVFDQAGYPELANNTFDLTDWYRGQAARLGARGERKIAELYYEPLMTLYAVFGALFENFDEGPNAKNGDLEKFRSRILEPAVERTKRTFGIAPVIVRIPAYETVGLTNLAFLDKDQRQQLEERGTLDEN